MLTYVESGTRVCARSPLFQVAYLDVPHPVAAAPIFSAVILGSGGGSRSGGVPASSGEEASPHYFVLASGASVDVSISCPTPRTRARYTVGPQAGDPRVGGSIALQPMMLEQGSTQYRASCDGPEARASQVADVTYTLVMRPPWLLSSEVCWTYAGRMLTYADVC